MTSTYTPTLMEKLLGRNYKWWYIIIYNFKINTVYLWNEVFSSLNKTVIVASSLIIFSVTNQGNSYIITYLILGNLFFTATDPMKTWFVGNSIKDGKITRFLITPQSYFKFIFFLGISTVFFMIITYFISLVPLSLFFINSVIFSWRVLWLIPLWFVVSTLRIVIDLLMGLTAFWTTEIYGSAYLNITFTAFLSGSMFPLNFISDKITLLNYTPYSFMLYHPMQIYLGNYNFNQTLLVFAGGIAWCLVLYFLAKWVFKVGLKKNESVGL